MFCVFGKSRALAKKTVDKRALKKGSDINTELLEMTDATQDEKQSVVDQYIDEEFKAMKPKRCTHEFSTPSIAREALELMQKDESNFSELALMKKQQQINAEGKPLVTAGTRKPKMEWVPIHTVQKEVLAA